MLINNLDVYQLLKTASRITYEWYIARLLRNPVPLEATADSAITIADYVFGGIKAICRPREFAVKKNGPETAERFEFFISGTRADRTGNSAGATF